MWIIMLIYRPALWSADRAARLDLFISSRIFSKKNKRAEHDGLKIKTIIRYNKYTIPETMYYYHGRFKNKLLKKGGSTELWTEFFTFKRFLPYTLKSDIIWSDIRCRCWNLLAPIIMSAQIKSDLDHSRSTHFNHDTYTLYMYRT